MMNALKPIWADTQLRLDPLLLPHYLSFALQDETGDVSMTIDTRGVVIKRKLPKSQLPFTIALPCQAFQGVAARAIEDGLGGVTVTLELMHNDPELSVPLLVARDFDDIAGDWRTWSQKMNLPMLLVEADGVARRLDETIKGIQIDPTSGNQRRRYGHSYDCFRSRDYWPHIKQSSHL
jgi:hypothetical protein